MGRACGGIDARPEHRLPRSRHYRLNVFPIHLPPLRERAEDIPALVRYFVDRFSRRMNRHIEVIPDEALAALQRCAWPGNIRELSNFIERAVILSSGPTLEVPIDELDQSEVPLARKNGGVTLEQLERESILGVLEESNWLIAGPRGAAARLGMKRTTLQSLLKRLEISRPVPSPS